MSVCCRWWASRLVIVLAFFVIFFAFGVPAQAADNRESTIYQRGVLRVCIWPDYYSITFRNPRTGTLEGIDIDMARAFAADLGVSVAFIESSFARLIENLSGNACDIAMHAVGVRTDRAAHVAFSAPTLISGIYAVTIRDHPTIHTWADIDRPGIVVVVQKGTYMEPEMRRRLVHAELRVVSAIQEREREVESGRADVFMTDYPYGRRMADLTDWALLIEPPVPVAPTAYAYALPKNEPAWLDRVNRFVASVKADGRLRAAAERHRLLPILAE